jgi:hypothetical protein
MNTESVQETLAGAIKSDPEQINALMHFVNMTIDKSNDIATSTVNPRGATAMSLNSEIDKGINR